jgi:phosphatidylglycerophosphatase A
MREPIVKLVATGFGAGRLPFAPGLAGSVVGVGYWCLLARAGNAWVYWTIFLAGILFAVWCAGEAAELLRKPDPPSVVIDEIVAVPLAFAGLGAVWWKLAVAFVLFRVFDVWKPWPARQSQAFSGGVGIVVDDLVAAGYACAGAHGATWVAALLSR